MQFFIYIFTVQISNYKLYFMWIFLIILIFQVKSVPNIASISTEYIKYNSFESLSQQIIALNPTDTNALYYDITLTRARNSTLLSSQIIFGLSYFFYDTEWYQDSGDDRQRMVYQLQCTNFANSGFRVEVIRPYGGFSRLRTRFLVWDSTFRHYRLFETYELTFTPSSSTQDQNIGFDYYDCKIIPFLKGVNLISNNAKFGYMQVTSIGPSTNNSFSSSLNFYGNQVSFTIRLRYLVINYNALINKDIQIYQNYQIYIPSKTVQQLIYSNSVPYYSYNISGLQSFQYDVTNHGSGVNDFAYFFIQIPGDKLGYLLNGGFQRLRYNYFQITFKYCIDPDYPVLFRNVNTSDLECFNQCYDGYYLTYTSDNEYKCNKCSYKCILCDQNNTCITCATEFIMDSNGTCLLRKEYFCDSTNSTIIHMCTYNSNLTNCLECQTNGYYCQKCALSYYLDTNNLCQPCNALFPNCINCTISGCYECAPPLTLLNTTQCDNPANSSTISRLLPCKDIRCASCLQSALDDCLRCYDSNLVIKNGYCVNNCGNGLIYQNNSDSSTQVCDDGNSIDFDGCSSDCSKLQQGFQCMNTSLIPNTTCYYSKPITLTLISTRKLLRQNKVELILRNSAPNILVWSTFDMSALKQILTLRVPNMEVDEKGYTFQYTVKFINYSSSGSARLLQSNQPFDGSLYEFLFVQVYYTPVVTPGVSLNNQIVEITFSPNISRMLIFNINSTYYTPPSLVRFSLNSDDTFLVQYFSPDYLSSCQTIEGFSIVISILTLIMIGIAVIAQFLDGINTKQMIITIETTCIVQFTYFSLLGVGPMNPMFVSMAEGLKYTSGFDINLSDSKTKIKQLIGMNIQSGNIEGNLNLSVIFPLIFLIAGLVMLLMKRLKRQKSHTIQQNYDNIETIEKKEQQQNNLKQKTQYKIKNSESLLQKPQNLILNFGFCLFIFFLYKYFVFTFIQVIQNIIQLQFIGVFIIGVVAILLLFFIFTLFRKFEFYQDMAQKICYEKPLSINKQTILRNQFLLFIFERLLNSFSVTVLGFFIFNGLIPLIIYILKQIFIYKYLQNIYHPSHKIRLYLAYLFGFTIQILLITRRVFIESVIKGQGGQQPTYGLYLPYSILILLLIILLKGITFQIYSIKRIRCCKLDIEWQNQNKDKNKKQKVKPLQNLQQLNQDSHSDKIDKNNNLHEKLGQTLNKYQQCPSINKKLLYSSKNIYNNTNQNNKLLQQSEDKKSTKSNKFNQEEDKSQYNEQEIIKKIKNQNKQSTRNLIGNINHNNSQYNQQNQEQQQQNYDQKQNSLQLNDQFQNNKKQPNLKSTTIKKEIKNELQKLRLINKQEESKQNKGKKLKNKINYRLNQTNQQQQQIDMSYFGLNKDKQTTQYKYTDQKKYNVGDQYDMI